MQAHLKVFCPSSPIVLPSIALRVWIPEHGSQFLKVLMSLHLCYLYGCSAKIRPISYLELDAVVWLISTWKCGPCGYMTTSYGHKWPHDLKNCRTISKPPVKSSVTKIFQIDLFYALWPLHCCNACALTCRLVTQWRRCEGGEAGMAPSKESCRKQFEQVNCIMQRLRLDAAGRLDIKHCQYFGSDWYLLNT